MDAMLVGRTARRSVVAGATPVGRTAKGDAGRAAGRDVIALAGAMPIGGTANQLERQISPGRNLQTFGGGTDMHMFITLMVLIVFRGARRKGPGPLQLEVARKKEHGMALAVVGEGNLKEGGLKESKTAGVSLLV